MTTAIPLDADGRVWLAVGEVAALTDITPRMLDHWTRNGVITPAQPSTGSGYYRRFNAHNVAALTAIAQVRADLNSIGADMELRLVGELWDQLEVADTATIEAGTVTICVHLAAS